MDTQTRRQSYNWNPVGLKGWALQRYNVGKVDISDLSVKMHSWVLNSQCKPKSGELYSLHYSLHQAINSWKIKICKIKSSREAMGWNALSKTSCLGEIGCYWIDDQLQKLPEKQSMSQMQTLPKFWWCIILHDSSWFYLIVSYIVPMNPHRSWTSCLSSGWTSVNHKQLLVSIVQRSHACWRV